MKKQNNKRPPAYPQVEHLSELDDCICRFCEKDLSDEIDLDIVEIKVIKNGGYIKWTCKCSNIIKIVSG